MGEVTTIVYEHKSKLIACDGRLIRGMDIRSESFEKWRETEHGIAFFAGTVADVNSFISHMGSDFSKFPVKTNTTCILVRDGKAYECCFDDEDGYFEVELQFNAAIGSGGIFALSALDFGCDIDESVKYASKRDAGTGGKVSVYSIDKEGFLR